MLLNSFWNVLFLVMKTDELYAIIYSFLQKRTCINPVFATNDIPVSEVCLGICFLHFVHLCKQAFLFAFPTYCNNGL